MTCYELGKIDSQSSFLLVACEMMKWDIDLRKDGKCSNGCLCVKSIYRELEEQVQWCVSQDLGRWVPELYSKTSCGQMLGPDTGEGVEERAK